MRVSPYSWHAALLLALLPLAPLRPQASSPDWLLVLAAEAGHQDAVRFQSPDDPGDGYWRARADLRRHWNGMRGAFDIVLSGDASKYRVLSDLDRFNYGVAARANRRLTPRANATFSAAARSVIAADLTVAAPDAGTSGADMRSPVTEPASGLVSAGPRLPRVAAHLVATQAGFDYRLAPHTTSAIALGVSHASFDSPLLLASTTAAARATLQHRVGRHGGALLQYDVQRGSAQGQTLGVDELGAGWDQEIGPLTGRVTAGATHSTTSEGSHVEPTGAAQLAAAVAGGTATVDYSRRVSQALGLGTLLTSNRVTARYQRDLFDAWAVTMSASHAWSRDPSPPIGRSGNTDGAAELKHVFAGGLLVGGAVTYRRREQDQLPTLQGFDTRLYLGVVAGVGS